LSATFALYEEAGHGERRTLVLMRRGSGDQSFVMLATEGPIADGDTFNFKGFAYCLTRPREVFEGWEAEPVAQ
jgi:hypothetical protein